MSLRLRLLVAVGLIAIVALVVADFATYSALRTTLYNQVDQQLAHQPPRLVQNVVSGRGRLPVAAARLRWRRSGRQLRRRSRPREERRLPQRRRHQLRRRREPGRRRRRGPRVPSLRGGPPLSPPAAVAHHRLRHPARRDPGRPVHHRLRRLGRPGLPRAGDQDRRDPPTTATSWCRRRHWSTSRAPCTICSSSSSLSPPAPSCSRLPPGGGWSGSACGRWRTSSAPPTPSRRGTSTSGSRAPTRRPRSGGWRGR